MSMGLLLLFSLLFFLVFGTPIVASIGLACVLAMVSAGNYNALPAVTQKMFTAVDSFPLLALPLFTLSGALMEVSGISERLVAFMKMVFRFLPAASACITTISATFFGAISGSAPATAAAIGGVMIRPMIKNGYKPEEAAAINASSGSLGIIIPPSIPMVIFATAASVSVGSLFMSGVVPGLLIMVVFCAIHVIRYRHVERAVKERVGFRQGWRIFIDAIFALGMPAVILGGIYGGIFTPTEAAAVSCLYAIAVGAGLYRSLPLAKIFEVLQNVGVRVSSMILMVAIATAMAWYVSSSGLTKVIANAILTGLENRILVLTAINLLLFFLGCFLDPAAIILLTCPIIIPITRTFGMSTVAVGTFVTINMALGMITPPVAGTIYISNQIARMESIGPMTAKLLPYVFAMGAITLLVTYFPEICIWLPRTLGMSV